MRADACVTDALLRRLALYRPHDPAVALLCQIGQQGVALSGATAGPDTGTGLGPALTFIMRS